MLKRDLDAANEDRIDHSAIRITDYDRKPPACSSPIIEVHNGREYRVHDGHYAGSFSFLVPPSKYPVKPETLGE